MSVTPWEPFGGDLQRMIERFFEEPRAWSRFPRLAEGLRMLPIDMYETSDEIVLKATVAGVKPEDVDISVTGNLLTIKAERKEQTEIQGADTIRRERYFGRFERSITLPMQVQADKAQATFENGELTLRLPKAEEAKAKTIKVQTATQ